MNITVERLESFVMEASRRAGVCESESRIMADVLVTTDTWGVFTHGTKALGNYLRRVRGGGLRSPATPAIVRQGPAWALMDAGSGLAMVTCSQAMRLAMDKARGAGIGFVGVKNNCHYGAAGYYAAMALTEGMIGLSMANDIPTVNGPGALGPILGSNPFAFAAPAGKERPILLDMATSTVAGGKVFAAAVLGKPIPPHWLVDQNGQPTADPTLFSHAASLTPMAGYKGFGLAFMIEILSAVLTGAAVNREVLSWSFADPALPTGHGAAFIALNISNFMPVETFKDRVDTLAAMIRAEPRMPGAKPAILPGQIEWENRERALRGGIELPEDVHLSLRKTGADCSLEFEAFAKPNS